MIVNQKTYRKAFLEYLRKGTPIMRSVKQERPTSHYIWRTQNDDKVRGAHAHREGQIFSWEMPPAGGHPGEEHNCRCTAEPYYGEEQEFVSHTLGSLNNTGKRWDTYNFLYHFFMGKGRGVTLSEIGHLTEIVEYWAYKHGALERWTRDIISDIRRDPTLNPPPFFDQGYNFGSVEFSHGRSNVRGEFSGVVEQKHGMFHISGKVDYKFIDEFTDPLDIRQALEFFREGSSNTNIVQNVSELSGDRYPVTGTWTSSFEALIFIDKEKSKF